MKTELVQTKNVFKLKGFVTRIDKDGAYKEEVMTKQGNKREGETYRSMRFGVKTSETNEITVQAFDYEPKEVFMWNSDKKKADSSYKGDRFPFEQWLEQQDELREQGYSPLQSRVGLDYGEDGKLISKGLPSFVASQEIYNKLSNGDAVAIEGEIRYSKYKPANSDEEVEQKTYTIKKVFRLKELDFEDAKFEEVTYFEQEMVFVDTDIDKQEGVAYVTGRVIDFMKNYHDTQMVVRFKDADGNIDKGMVKLAETFKKRFNFGDVITVYGDTFNRVVVKEVEEQEEEKDLFAEFGGRQKPKHAQTYTAREYIQEMSINGIEALDEKVYTEDDFIKDDGLLGGKDKTEEFGGKKQKNPFSLGDDDSDDDMSDSDLPF